VGLLESVAADRWSRPRNLTDTLERLAAMSAFAGAEQAGTLDDVEDELFRFGRALEREPALRAALSDPNLPTERKRAVVEALLVGRAQAVTVMIVDRIVQAPRGRTLESALAEYSELAARRRDRTLATVTTAVPLTDVQHRRLAAALTRIYGRRVVLQADLDPDVVGGVRVRIGDEIIDGTVVTRLALAARRIAGAP
jgi:F-type H+-transporting ATPase subunit delta